MIYTKAESFYDQHSRWQDTDGKQSGDGSVSASTEDSHLLYGNRPTSNTDNDLLRLESSYFRVYEELADSQSLAPSIDPTPRPTRVPSALKSRKPTNMPSERPTRNPTIKPSFTPTQLFLASTNIIVSQYLVSLSPAESFYSDESATSSFISCVNQIIPPNGTVSILNISDISDLSSSGQILLTDQTNRQLSQTMYNIDISYNVAYFLYDSSDLSSMSQEIKQNVTADLTSSVNDGSFLYLLHNTSSSALRNISSLGEPVISSGDINYVYTLLPTIAPSSRPSSFHPTRRPSVMASFSPTMYSTTILEDTYIITLCAVGFGIGLIIVGILLLFVCRMRVKAAEIKMDVEDLAFPELAEKRKSTELLRIAYGPASDSRNSLRSNRPMSVRLQEMRGSIQTPSRNESRYSYSRKSMYDVNMTVE